MPIFRVTSRHLRYLASATRSPFRISLRAYTDSSEKQPTNYESKYASKLLSRAAQKGMSYEDLKESIKKKADRERRRLAEERRLQAKAAAASTDLLVQDSSGSSVTAGDSASRETKFSNPANGQGRKDSSPIKPLSSILNIPRILSTPHTAEQISALWTAYHTSRPRGGYICASIPVGMYERMVEVAEKYPSFVAPLTRESPEAEKTEAYEFYFLQWAFHGAPPPPSLALDDPFHVPRTPHAADYPPISTILFTPLQEYKLRESFATPYLVLTHYTDFARTHGIVLLRGEVTPGASGAGHLLSQADAQLLALAIQKFYLWGPKGGDEAEGERLVKIFHQRPQEFKWEELLKHANLN